MHRHALAVAFPQKRSEHRRPPAQRAAGFPGFFKDEQGADWVAKIDENWIAHIRVKICGKYPAGRESRYIQFWLSELDKNREFSRG